MLLPRGSEAISPTGHYTGYVWVRNGLAPQELATPEGRLFFHALEPVMRVSRLLGRPTFEGMLVARHRMLDLLLAGAIERGEIGQVIEIAAGLSARGWRFVQRYDGVTYVEADLPRMAARKQRLLQRLSGPGPRVTTIDALADDGPDSIAAVADTLDPEVGTAIVTEGLLNYFDLEAVTGMWHRFAEVLRRFPTGAYFADVVLRPQANSMVEKLGAGLLAATVRGRVHLHFDTEAEVAAALAEAAFPAADVVPAGTDNPGARLVHVIDAWT
ncbi:class I SAM-dependent methyltransferase [Amycolatopsis acidiphila]|uniref:class I SAM-dependent methyltransferase n=1 Tax=Amycolatopsis acidiphila TaxID=715473 RepID=UPI001643A12A|nr:class I SAM-dependent methyltransferase [Amycolatopsis acidiphila]UIJ58277.1 class I SAM-dependent methyltransferase [Amycolatopsis acidiphila]